MSVEDAQKQIAESSAKVKKQDAIILKKEGEISILKKQLADAEKALTRARNAKLRIESKNIEASNMVNSDVDLILQKIKNVESDRSMVRASETLGQKNAMDDMIALTFYYLPTVSPI